MKRVPVLRPMTDTDGTARSPCSCKVSTAAVEFGLDGVHRQLRREWEADERSVRELTRWFNERLFEAAFEEVDRLPIDGEIANLHRVFTDDDVDAGSRAQARELLRRDGVRVDDAETATVSHQTLYRHLTGCLDAERSADEATTDERLATWRTRLRALRNRTEAVTAQAVDQLRADDAVSVGSFDVLLDVTVLCEDCGAALTVEELLDGAACDCSEE